VTVRLVDAGWGRELTDALRADAGELRVISPFIKAGALDRLLSLSLSYSRRCGWAPLGASLTPLLRAAA